MIRPDPISPGNSVRILLGQIEVMPGRPRDNCAAMLTAIRYARADKVNIVVFPEMAIPGYLIGDEWERESFLRECEACAAEICAASKGLVVVFGSVGVDWKRRNEDGRVRKYNALFVAENGRYLGPECGPYKYVIKTLTPNYRAFDESRHFFDLRKLAVEQNQSIQSLLAPVKTSRLSLGCILCEDAWDDDYGVSPINLLCRQKADLFINASSSPFTVNKNHKRNRVFSSRARAAKRPFVFVNNVGIQNNGKTVFTFDGSSCVYDAHGNILPAGKPFASALCVADVPLRGHIGKPLVLREDGIAEIDHAISYGTRSFMDLCGVSKVVIGLSGGIDSAVVAALYRRILKRESLLLINIPGEFTSRTTRKLAATLAENLDCFYAEIPIEDSVKLTCRQLDGLIVRAHGPDDTLDLRLSPLAMENVQARDRSSRILAAAAAAFGGVFTCNANKSETTVGYSTLYGDLGGYLANIADLWKDEIYQLAEHMNSTVYRKDVIPRGIFDVTPSAELSPRQNVDKKMGDPLIYPYHDCLFRSWVESWNRTSPEEILGWYARGRLEKEIGYKGKIRKLFRSNKDFISDLERWWNQYQGMGLVKRIQAPPILAVKRRAFGFDHRESFMRPRYTHRYELLKKRLAG